MRTMRQTSREEKKLLIAALVTLMLIATTGLGGESDSSSTAQFLRIGVGARAVGMGGAYTAVGDDITSLYWNPAGIAMQDGREAEFVYNSWFEDVFQAYAAYSQPVFRAGSSFGVSLNYVGIGDDIEGRDEHGNRTGDLDFANYAFGVSYGHRFNDWIRVGGTIKYIRQELDKYDGTAWGIDLGTQLHPYPKLKDLTVALVIQNLGTKMNLREVDEPLPRTFRIGAAYRLELFDNNLTLATDLEMPRDTDPKFHAGAEYSFGDILALRAGYHTGDEAEGPSLGLGYRAKPRTAIKWLDFEIGYVYVPFDDVLGDTHRFSLHFRF